MFPVIGFPGIGTLLYTIEKVSSVVIHKNIPWQRILAQFFVVRKGLIDTLKRIGLKKTENLK